MTEKDVNKISIRLLPDGFSYYNQYHAILPGADYIQRLEEALLDAIEAPDQPETDVCVCAVDSLRFCLSPLGDEDAMAERLYRFSTPSPDQDETLLHLKDEAHGFCFTLGIDSHLYHFLLRNLPEITFTHPLFEFIEQWIDKAEVQEDCMVAQTGSNHLDILIFKAGKLYLANRFEAKEADNILYHLMNCWTQHGLDVIDHKLYLDTEVADLKQNIGQYIKQCV